MAKTKKIYRYVRVRVRKCYACTRGRLMRGTMICSHCGGEGWHYKSVRRLVGEEVVK